MDLVYRKKLLGCEPYSPACYGVDTRQYVFNLLNYDYTYTVSGAGAEHYLIGAEGIRYMESTTIVDLLRILISESRIK